MKKHTRGGGSGRLRTRAASSDPFDAILHDLSVSLRDTYRRERDPVAQLLEKHLKPYADRKTADLEPKEKTALWMSMFAGQQWLSTRRLIAYRLREADRQAIKAANDLTGRSFAEGANGQAYKIKGGGGSTRGGGAGRGRPYEPLVYTEDVVTALTAASLIEKTARALDDAKDLAYLTKRIQSAVTALALQHTPVRDIPDKAARRIILTVYDGMTTAAETRLYAAYDSGAYEAGMDAMRAGVEVEKTWLGIPDGHIRDSHRHLNGTTIPMDELFYGLDGVLRFPHDPRAPASEIMNCRCRMAIHRRGHAPPKYASAVITRKDTAEYKKWRDAEIKKAGGDLLKKHLQARRG